jgi:glutathione S-transferase
VLKIYGTSMSRAGRCLWALEETGVTYEHIPTAMADLKTPAHLKLNPNGRIPVIDDDGFVLWESIAINLFIAEKYGNQPLWPSTLYDRALTNQWSYWAMTEVESSLVAILRNRMILPAEQRSEAAAVEAIEKLKAPLAVIESHLSNREYLIGKEFTIADLNTAAVWNIGTMVGVDFSSAPKTKAWLLRCTSRPANQRAGQHK